MGRHTHAPTSRRQRRPLTTTVVLVMLLAAVAAVLAVPATARVVASLTTAASSCDKGIGCDRGRATPVRRGQADRPATVSPSPTPAPTEAPAGTTAPAGETTTPQPTAPGSTTSAPTGTTAPETPVPAPPPAAVSLPGGTRSALFGVSIPAGYLHHSDDLEARLDEVVALGARWVRTSAHFSWVEPQRGEPDWSELDALVQAMDERGLSLLLDLNRMPAWARPSGATEHWGPSTATERAAFVDFAERVAERYAGSVDAWEVWNEANLDQFWAPAPDVADYTQLLKETYPVLKQADPTAPVLITGTGGIGGGGGDGLDVDSVTWYEGVYAHGGRAYFDVANIHPYQMQRESVASGDPDTGHMALTDDVRQVMAAHGDGAKPMWGTEFGAATSGTYSVTEAGQVDIYTAGRDLWYSREPGGVLFAYYLRDREPYGSSSSRSPYWGLLRADGSAKPAYVALRDWLRGG